MKLLLLNLNFIILCRNKIIIVTFLCIVRINNYRFNSPGLALNVFYVNGQIHGQMNEIGEDRRYLLLIRKQAHAALPGAGKD